MSDSSNIAILIPAAGNSSRLGTPKQLLKWKGSTLLAHTIKTAEHLHCKQIILILGSDFDAISSTVEEDQITLLNNKNWQTGLGGSIAFGIQHILEIELVFDGVLIMLPDQPLIEIDHFKAMIDNFESGQDQIIATKYGNDKNGVPALFDRKYFYELGELTNDLGAKYLLKKYPKDVMALGSTQIPLDIDTMDDYKTLYQANHQL